MDNSFYTRFIAEFIRAGLGGGYAADGTDAPILFTDGEGHPLELDLRLLGPERKPNVFGEEQPRRERTVRAAGIGVIIGNPADLSSARLFVTSRDGKKTVLEDEDIDRNIQAVRDAATGSEMRLGPVDFFTVLRPSFSDAANAKVKHAFSDEELARQKGVSEDISPYMRFLFGKDALAKDTPDILSDIHPGSDTALFMESRYAMAAAAHTREQNSLAKHLDIESLFPSASNSEGESAEKEPVKAEEPGNEDVPEEEIQLTRKEIRSFGRRRLGFFGRFFLALLGVSSPSREQERKRQENIEKALKAKREAAKKAKEEAKKSSKAEGESAEKGQKKKGRNRKKESPEGETKEKRPSTTPDAIRTALHNRTAEQLMRNHPELLDVKVGEKSLFDFITAGGRNNINPVRDLLQRIDTAAHPALIALEGAPDGHLKGAKRDIDTASIPGAEKGLKLQIPSVSFAVRKAMDMARKLDKLTTISLDMDRGLSSAAAGENLAVMEQLKERLSAEFRRFEKVLCGSSSNDNDYISQVKSKSQSATRELVLLDHVAKVSEIVKANLQGERAEKAIEVLCGDVLDNIKASKEEKPEIKEVRKTIKTVRTKEAEAERAEKQRAESAKNAQKEGQYFEPPKETPKEDQQESLKKEKDDLLKVEKEFEQKSKDVALGIDGTETHFQDPDKTGERTESEAVSAEDLRLGKIAEDGKKHLARQGFESLTASRTITTDPAKSSPKISESKSNADTKPVKSSKKR